MSINGLSRLPHRVLVAMLESLLFASVTPQACWAEIDGAAWFGMPGDGWNG